MNENIRPEGTVHGCTAVGSSRILRSALGCVIIVSLVRPMKADTHSISWLDMSPVSPGASVATGSVFTLPNYGNVRIDYVNIGAVTHTRFQDTTTCPCTLTNGSDSYLFSNRDSLDLVNYGQEGSSASYQVQFTLLNGPLASGMIVLGVNGLGRLDLTYPGNITRVTVNQNGTFLGDIDLGSCSAPTLFQDSYGSFDLVNSLPGPVGGCNPNFNSDLGIVLLGDSILSVTLDVQHIGQDGIAFSLGWIDDICVGRPTGMVGWWPLDETSGTLAHDIMAGHTGTYSNAPMPDPGKVNGSLLFHQFDAVEVPDHAALNFPADQDFSFDAWIRVYGTAETADTPIVSKIVDSDGSLVPGYRFYTTNGPPRQLALDLWDGTSYSSYVAPGGISDEDWHFVAVTVDRDDQSGAMFYLDGLLVGSFDPRAKNVNLSNGSSLWIGNDYISNIYQYSPDYWLDEVEVLDRVLAPEEIAILYNADSLGKCRLCNPRDDDGWEENDSCSSSVALPSGLSWGNLYTSKFDHDWYRMSVPSQEILNVYLYFTNADGDINARLYNACGGMQIASGTSMNDGEHIVWTNSSSVTKDVYLQVYVDESSAKDCNKYGLAWYTLSMERRKTRHR